MLFKEDKVARADAEAIRRGVGFYRWTHDLVEITGKDALEVLQKIYISDISKVAVGRSKYTASLDENGEIIDDVIVMHMADGLYWVSDLYGPRLLPWIEQHKGEADIHAKIITYDWDMYAVQGPDSLKAMNAMLDAPVDDLKRFGICERKLGDIPVYIHRSGFTGENGYEIYSAFDKSAEVHDLALKAVASVGGRELLQPVGDERCAFPVRQVCPDERTGKAQHGHHDGLRHAVTSVHPYTPGSHVFASTSLVQCLPLRLTFAPLA